MYSRFLRFQHQLIHYIKIHSEGDYTIDGLLPESTGSHPNWIKDNGLPELIGKEPCKELEGKNGHMLQS